MKVSALCVPALLTPDQIAQADQIMGKSDIVLDQANFLKRLLTKDECKVHNFEAMTKTLSMLLKYGSFAALKTSEVSYVCMKFNGHIFYGKYVVFIDYLQNGYAIDGANFPGWLQKAIKKKNQNRQIKFVSLGQCPSTQGFNGYCASL